jgi:membrane fusion protein (multidrug efflux system)
MFSNRNSLKLSIGIITLLVLSVLAYCVFHYLELHPSTDDAYVQANTINVAAQVTGPVLSIHVADHEVVEKGRLLFTIDPALFEVAVLQAQAVVAEKKSAEIYALQNAQRFLHLVDIGQEPKSTGDQYQSQLDNSKAALAAAQAQLDQAKLNLAHTQVYAPQAGIVTQFELRPGNNVVANTTLFMIVEQSQFWIDANFKETQVARIRKKQSADIVLDMFPDHTFHGYVDAVSSASGSVFSLLPPENASGNWVKVTQRFPVKIIIQDPDPNFPLRAGATASVTIDTSNKKL